VIWLDSAATTFQKPNSVKAAVSWALEHCASPGRGGSGPGMEAAKTVFHCRELAGELFSCKPENVVFTMNATHGLNIAVNTLVPRGGRVIVSGFEHNAVMRPLYARDAQIAVAGRKLFDPENTLREFAAALENGADCAVCTHVSNVFGYILPVEEIGKLCRKRGVPFIVDASQSAGVLPVSPDAMQADFIAMPGHKSLYGPQGIGLLLCARLPKPLISGGTGSLSLERTMPEELPDRAEAGTHNVPGICGLGAGLRFVLQKGTARIFRHELSLRRLLEARLSGRGFTLFSGQSCTGVLSVGTGVWDCEEAAAFLAGKGIAVRAGLHCAPLAHESAGTLEGGTLRLSPSAFSTPEDVETAAFFLASHMGKSRK